MARRGSIGVPVGDTIEKFSPAVVAKPADSPPVKFDAISSSSSIRSSSSDSSSLA
jgi:hypothetical protein